eukprot:15460648-Alexandrium_andersonii.AAC.1
MLLVGCALGPTALPADPAGAAPACHFSKVSRQALALAASSSQRAPSIRKSGNGPGCCRG